MLKTDRLLHISSVGEEIETQDGNTSLNCDKTSNQPKRRRLAKRLKNVFQLKTTAVSPTIKTIDKVLTKHGLSSGNQLSKDKSYHGCKTENQMNDEIVRSTVSKENVGRETVHNSSEKIDIEAGKKGTV